MSGRIGAVGFFARPPWWGGDLQTLRDHLWWRRPPPALAGGERIEFPMPDGDRLVGTLDRPTAASDRPLVVLIHGLTGCQDSGYMRISARYFLAQHYPVLRLNLRGAGPSRPLCRSSYHAGRSEDLQAVLAQMDGRLARHGLLLVGYSLGGNMLLKHLGEQGRRAQILAAASISAPIDLKATQLSMSRWRNRLYHDFLLRRMKDEALGSEAGATPAERAAMPRIATIREFDERIVAPRNGFQGAEDYYARCSASQFLRQIRVPTLVIHALNDPWIPGRLYRAVDWRANPRLKPVLPRSGGHVGFHGWGAPEPAHDRWMSEFFAAARR
jgi:predicted alpha/beta-fold hydrolase